MEFKSITEIEMNEEQKKDFDIYGFKSFLDVADIDGILYWFYMKYKKSIESRTFMQSNENKHEGDKLEVA